MKNFLYTFLFLCFIIIIASSCSTKNLGASSRIYSENIKDSFELYVDLPKNYKPDTGYSVVFYMDANLKLGTEIRRQLQLEENRLKFPKVIFVGVGHMGNYRSLRRRDFIPPLMRNGQIEPSSDPLYGQAENFYKFLRYELIPYVDKTYSNNGKYTYIGHSFSGLFAFYCLMKADPLFTNYVAISPSLWVNNSNIFDHEQSFSTLGHKPKGSLYHSCGSREWINKVLYSSRKMKGVLDSRKYPLLHYIYTEHPRKNHNGTVPVSFEYMFNHMNL